MNSKTYTFSMNSKIDSHFVVIIEHDIFPFTYLDLKERMIISEGRGEIQGFINGLRRGAGWMKRGFKSEKTN